MARDLSGMRFGKLVALEDTGKRTKPGNNAIWLCKCDCGRFIEVRSSNLTTLRRPQKSCGCILKESVSKSSYVHGGTGERLYGIWMGMRRRCYDPKIKSYARYGGRGIRVCDEWQDYAVFRTWALENGYDPTAKFQECTIDRINPSGNYEPQNCRWVDIKTQENNRRNNVLIDYNGKRQSMKLWAEELGVNYGLLRDRLERGWSFERAITEPRQEQFLGKGFSRHSRLK